MRSRKKKELEGDQNTAQFGSGESLKPEPGTWRHAFLLCVFLAGFRTVNAILCTTSFVPDEYWQSLEVAHRMVFGYGHLTWEWRKAIRGYTHPLVFAGLYKILAVSGLDWPYLVVVLPRILQALLAAVGDYHVLKLATFVYGARAGKYALLCNLMSWFTFYCCSRTLSNSTEAALTPVVLYYWIQACSSSTKQKHALRMQVTGLSSLIPRLHRRKKMWPGYTLIYLALAAVSFLVRPTGAVLWAPLLALQIIKQSSMLQDISLVALSVGIIAFLWSLLVDWFFYGHFTLVQLNFALFNVFDGHSALYGTHPWHWYIFQGVPTVLFTSLPLCLLGVWWSRSAQRAMFWLSLGVVLIHSCLGHKEFRFVFAIVPVGSVYAGYCISKVLQNKAWKVLHLLTYALLIGNIPMAAYFSFVHQRGTTAVMDYLRGDVTISNSSVLFLMPCHSTPFYSHIHASIPMTFLECPPPIDPSYIDEEEQFYSNPVSWLDRQYPESSDLPSHIVTFNSLLEVTRIFHTHIPENSRFGTHVLVFRKI